MQNIYAEFISASAFSIKNKKTNAVLTELVFLLLVSLIIKKPCLTAAAAPLICPHTAKP